MGRKLNDRGMTIRQPSISISNQVFTSLATLDLLPAFETLGSDRYPKHFFVDKFLAWVMIQQILHVCIFYWSIIFAMTSHKQIICSLFREGWGAGVHKHDPRAGAVVQIPIAIARHMLCCIIYCMSSLRGLPAIWRCSRRPSGTSGQQAYHQDQYFLLNISASFTNNAMFTQIFYCFPKSPWSGTKPR